MLRCEEATRLISESLDARLPLHRRLSLRIHLLMCRFCSRYHRQMRIIRDAVRWGMAEETREEGLERPMPPESLSPEAAARIERVLKKSLRS